MPFAAPTRVMAVGAKTLDFLRVFERYPRHYRMNQAAQTWQELAATWPGGERALADEICAAFDGGLLRRPPYDGPDRHRPKFETFLAERLWLDPASAPDGSVDRRDPDRLAERTTAALVAKRVPEERLATPEQIAELRAERLARNGR